MEKGNGGRGKERKGDGGERMNREVGRRLGKRGTHNENGWYEKEERRGKGKGDLGTWGTSRDEGEEDFPKIT